MKIAKNDTSRSEIPTRKIRCRCGCGRYLTPNFEREILHDRASVFGTRYGKVIRITGYGYMNNNIFQTLRCGFNWAVYKNQKPT